MVTKKAIEAALKEIPDPEIGVSILDLGLIYNIDINDGKIDILMTLTTIGCPLFDQIAYPMRSALGKITGVKEVEINLTFEPPWTPQLMSEEAKSQLGFL